MEPARVRSSLPALSAATDHRRAGLAALTRVVQIAAVCLLIILIALASFLIFTDADLKSLQAAGLPGITLIMFLSSTVLLPAPGLAAVIGAGAANWHPVLVGMFAAIGAAGGESVGYWLGRGGRDVLDHHTRRWWFKRAERMMCRWGFLTLLVVSMIPNPFLDVLGILSGSLRYPAGKFVLAILIGYFVKCTAAAVFGIWTLSSWF